MNQIIQMKTINFAELVKTNTLKLSLDAQSMMIDLLTSEFTDEQVKRYIINLYMFLNFNPTTDFPVNLDHVYRDMGFANKGNAMKTIKSNFTKGEDYKILLIPTEKQVKTNGGAGLNKEDIMLNIDTYKTLCMLVKTSQGKEIRRYYVKLENIYNSIVKKEIETSKKEIETSKKLLELKDVIIHQLENKPRTEGFITKNGKIYAISDITKPGHTKIGYGDPSNRLGQLNVGSSTHSLEVIARFDTYNVEFAEKLIHYSLNPFRIEKRKEWFYFRTDNELAYAMNVIKQSISYIEQFNIRDFDQLSLIISKINVQEELKIIEKPITEIVKKERDDKTQKTNTQNAQKGKSRTDNFKGVMFHNEKKLWRANLKNDKESFFLGYFTDQIDGAKAYNDFALYLNKTKDTVYLLNDIPGYITVPRNVPEENKITIQSKITSKYNGVSYDSRRKTFIAGITCFKKTYNLGSSLVEIDCAKLYNQQALFFNNTLNTKYVLNEITDYVTIARDIHTEIALEIQRKKASKWIGVSRNCNGKWGASYSLNRKKIHIGTFETELDACIAYNTEVIELNNTSFTNYKVNNLEIN